LELLYSTIQIVHDEIIFVARYATPGTQYVAASMLITIGYCIVKLQQDLNFFMITLFGLAGLTTFLLYFEIMELLSRIAGNSKTFPKTHKSMLSPEFLE